MPRKYNHFVIHEPKTREVDSISFKDRIVQHCLVDYYLMPILERKLIYDNAACRKKKGTDFARNRLKYFLSNHYQKNKNNNGYYLRIDFRHYFESISHPLLKNKLTGFVKDNDILFLCFRIIDSFHKDINKGLPLGNQTSQCFALLYLDKFDRAIKEKFSIKYYVRYMDDLVVIDKSKDKLVSLLNYLKNIASNEYLSFNTDKTFIKPLKTKISFLGFTYQLSSGGKIYIKVLNEKYRRFKKHLKQVDDIKKPILSNNYFKYLQKREHF